MHSVCGWLFFSVFVVSSLSVACSVWISLVRLGKGEEGGGYGG